MVTEDVHARDKLAEAEYFLRQLENSQDDKKGFDFNLSAFVVAWRSVIDIMLYDFAEKFSRHRLLFLSHPSSFVWVDLTKCLCGIRKVTRNIPRGGNL